MGRLRQLARDTALAIPPIQRLWDDLIRTRTERDEARQALDGARRALEDARREHAAQPAPERLAPDPNVEAALVAERQARLVAEARALSQEDYENYARWRHLKATDRLLALDDFGVKPAVRHGYGKPPHPQMRALLEKGADRYRATLEGFLPLLPGIATIPSHPVEDASEPNWINPAFPAFDAIALYGLIATRRPRRFLEIGSGYSTKFARRAIRDHDLPTRIVSIDPEPRAEVDAICDEVVRAPLEDVPLSFFEAVTADDLIFFDGSHRTFQNSDVTVFFTEILPILPSGTCVGIHDIFWPMDYPPPWLEWYFSEQYMLACWLLAGDRLEVELPVHFAELEPDLMRIMEPFWRHSALQGAAITGGAFFFRVR